ncbi:MAG TPA: acyl carrier protein [Actinoplanes sp.]|jgi:acyl carrier protein
MTAQPRAGTAIADVRATIQAIVGAVLERDVDPSIDVFDQGATSLAFIRIVAEINERFGVDVDVAELEEASVDALLALVTEQLKSPDPVTVRD